jgi:hypothetical protein
MLLISFAPSFALFETSFAASSGVSNILALPWTYYPAPCPAQGSPQPWLLE